MSRVGRMLVLAALVAFEQGECAVLQSELERIG